MSKHMRSMGMGRIGWELEKTCGGAASKGDDQPSGGGRNTRSCDYSRFVIMEMLDDMLDHRPNFWRATIPWIPYRTLYGKNKQKIQQFGYKMRKTNKGPIYVPKNV